MTTATNSTPSQIMMLGDLAGTGDSPQLVATGVTPGTYTPTSTYSGGNINIAGQAFVIDAKGRIIFANNIAQSQAAPTATTSAPGFAQVGSNINVSAGVISISTATSSILGLVKPDGTSISNSGGTISIATATSSVLGVVKPDGTTITNTAGAISVPTATSSVLGLVKPDNVSITNTAGAISVPTATTSIKGLVQIGNNLTLINGILSQTYILTNKSNLNNATMSYSTTTLIANSSSVNTIQCNSNFLLITSTYPCTLSTANATSYPGSPAMGLFTIRQTQTGGTTETKFSPTYFKILGTQPSNSDYTAEMLFMPSGLSYIFNFIAQ